MRKAVFDSINEEDKQFKACDFSKASMTRHSFVNCTFENCNFAEAMFQNSKFRCCTFTGCNLSLMKVEGCRFQDVTLINCKIVGVEFFKCEKTLFTLRIEKCSLQYCNFSDLRMRGQSFAGSKLKDCYFTNTYLVETDFSNTDLQGTNFQGCDLSKADFSGATNYAIDPLNNKVRKAQFSLPEAANLLAGFDIVIT